MGFRPSGSPRLLDTLELVRYSLLPIACMFAIGSSPVVPASMQRLVLRSPIRFAVSAVRHHAGLAGVALAVRHLVDVLFGSLQRITAEQLGLSPILMSAANSSGGVMGKMIDAQSIVVASTATRWYGHEGDILRYVFLHSLVLAALVGVLVSLQAYVWPFTALVIHH